MQTDQSLFVDYIVAGVTASWQQVQTADIPIPELVRQQAWHILSFALDVPAAWPATRELLLTLAPQMEQAGFRDEWLPYLEKGVLCAQAVDDQQTTAECELQIGLLYRLTSRFDEASGWTRASIEHFSALGNLRGQARALNELAWLEHLQHHYDEATRHVEAAFSLVVTDDAEQAMCYRVQGMIAIGQRRWQEAEKHHLRALTLFQQNGDTRKSAWSRQNVGYALKEQGKFEEALGYYQEASAILQPLNDLSNLATVQMNLGNVLVCLKKSREALDYYMVAEKVFTGLNDVLNLARLHTCLGLAYLDLASYLQAQTAFQHAAHLYGTLKDELWKLNALDGLAMAYLGNQQYVEAQNSLEEALAAMPALKGNPYYGKLLNELTEHLQQAKEGQGLPTA